MGLIRANRVNLVYIFAHHFEWTSYVQMKSTLSIYSHMIWDGPHIGNWGQPYLDNRTSFGMDLILAKRVNPVYIFANHAG